MKNLKQPNKNDEEIYRNILDKQRDETKKEKLYNIKNKVFENYDFYRNNTHVLKNIQPSSDADIIRNRDLLIKNFENKPKDVKILENDIKYLQIDNYITKCPYCTIDGLGCTDHYFPKNIFPEYSIFSLNLVPCCDRCNRNKGEINRRERKIINPYFDEINEYKFIHGNLYKDSNEELKIEFFLEKPEEMEENFFEIVSSHFNELGLLTRYKENSPRIISELKDTIIDFNEDFEIIEGILLSKLKHHKEKDGLNTCYTVTIETIYNNLEEFYSYVKSNSWEI